MTLDVAAHLLIKPVAFFLAALPMLIENLRTGLVTNQNNAILFAVGLGVMVLGPTLGMGAFELPPLSPWMLVAFVPFAMFARGWVRGGAAKLLIALLPWFSPGEYLLVAAAGFLLAGVVGAVWRIKDVQIAPPILVIGFMVQALGAAVRHR
jgi:hypothetical protein